ncbi:toll/interleukin-1 receptor domain-containing adapter protein [Rhinichthys klamathensis goyatoka]|uniref:toll/interleukin-1 receptor domain-containing adapter protein n=1 Tax=Rhinichthys klamathensis goyatoka TaxID=3034132 RepID=UPI0024B49B89|nr:toll/interleukin-1 receptor domain-containing adapter protein [Rhinichthys klamathensis goyatoka]
MKITVFFLSYTQLLLCVWYEVQYCTILHVLVVVYSLKGWRRMEENRTSSIMGWFRQRFGKQRNESDQSKASTCSQECSSGHSNTTSISSSSSSSSSSSKPSTSAKPSVSEEPLPSVLFSSSRSSRRFDVYLCHTEKDFDLAQSLAGFLEDPCKGLRCFLQDRDCPLGGAVSTEILRAVRDSHCWVLLLTPHFLEDEWCLYQMHQVLSEGPISQRIIPAVINMPRSQIPLELRYVFTVDLNVNKEYGYSQVYKTVLHYLKDMCEKEKPSNESHSNS